MRLPSLLSDCDLQSVSRLLTSYGGGRIKRRHRAFQEKKGVRRRGKNNNSWQELSGEKIVAAVVVVLVFAVCSVASVLHVVPGTADRVHSYAAVPVVDPVHERTLGRLFDRRRLSRPTGDQDRHLQHQEEDGGQESRNLHADQVCVRQELEKESAFRETLVRVRLNEHGSQSAALFMPGRQTSVWMCVCVIPQRCPCVNEHSSTLYRPSKKVPHKREIRVTGDRRLQSPPHHHRILLTRSLSPSEGTCCCCFPTSQRWVRSVI